MNIMFVGFGRSARIHHLPSILENSSLNLAAVYDVNEDAKIEAKEEYGCVAFDSYEDALNAKNIDLAIILTRNNMHAQMACDFLNSGKNVLVTKPMATNTQEAEKMVSAAKNSGKKLLAWLPGRWGNDLKRLSEIIDDGTIGKVFMVRRCFNSFGRRCDWQTKTEFGGGYTLNWGPHLIDQPIQLIGEKIHTVYGVTKKIINPGDAEDMFYAVMQTVSGVTIISEYNVCADISYDWIVQGDKGTITIKGSEIIVHEALQPEIINPTVYRDNVDFRVSKEELHAEKDLADSNIIYEHIADVLEGKADYKVALDSALELIKIIDAVKESSKTNKIIIL